MSNVLKSSIDKKQYDEQLYIAMQPYRKRIMNSLLRSGSYASKLAEELKMNAKVVQFHLDILQKYELAHGAFDLESPSKGRPVAVRRFTLTERGQDIIEQVNNLHRP